jgi:nucleoside triphosphate diphosphatase
MDPILELIGRLRGENGCPWDRRQTPRSMTAFLIEETYELVDAVLSGSPGQVCDELGDVLFQVLFLAHIYQEAGHFSVDEMVRHNQEKMIRRHPHIFGDKTAETAAAVRRQWEAIKKEEKGDDGAGSLLDGIPAGMPALMRAHRVSERAAGAGFDWSDLAGVMEKVEEEWGEFNAEVADSGNQADTRRLAMEFGDLLFTLVNVARFARIHPETALAESTGKFEKRFRQMEAVLGREGRAVTSASRGELDRLWEDAKAHADP